MLVPLSPLELTCCSGGRSRWTEPLHGGQHVPVAQKTPRWSRHLRYHEPCRAGIIQIPQKAQAEPLAVQSLQSPPLNGCCPGTQPNFLLSNGPPPRTLIGPREQIRGDRWTIVPPGSELYCDSYRIEPACVTCYGIIKSSTAASLSDKHVFIKSSMKKK